MKKVLIGLLFAVGSVFALSGEEVYMQHCASCHAKEMMMDMNSMTELRKKMKNSTQEERQAMRQSMMQKMKNSDMKAPPMQMVSMRIKSMKDSKEQFVSFVKDYIQNPSQEKGYCMPMAYKRFGVMPAIEKTMKEEERGLVAEWLYDNFNGKWEDSMSDGMCEKKNSNMKCGTK